MVQGQFKTANLSEIDWKVTTHYKILRKHYLVWSFPTQNSSSFAVYVSSEIKVRNFLVYLSKWLVSILSLHLLSPVTFSPCGYFVP